MKDKILSTLGLMYRAKCLIFADAILEGFAKGRVKYLLLAKDASDKTKERYLKKCYYYQIPYCLDYDSDELSMALGKRNVRTIGVIDKGLASLLIKEKGGISNGETSKEKSEQ